MKLSAKQSAVLIAGLLWGFPHAYAQDANDDSLQPPATPQEIAAQESDEPLSSASETEQSNAAAIRILHIEKALSLDAIERGELPSFSEQFASAQRYAEDAPASPYADLTPEQQAYLQRLEDIENFDQIVEELEIKGGAWSPQIAEELGSLGDLLQAQGKYEKSIEIFDRAVHINRVNNGLFSPAQVPLVQKVVQGHIALGQWQEADERQQYAFYVQTRAYSIDDPRMIDVFERLARWNIATFFRGIDADPTPRLRQTYLLYRTAVESVATHFGSRDPRYLTLLRDVAGAADMLSRYSLEGVPAGTRNNPDLRMISDFVGESTRPQGRNDGGEQALQRIVEYYSDPARPKTDENAMALARAIADIGDWYLMRDRRQAALETYSQAYASLASAPNADILLPKVFGVIEFLPTFASFDEEHKEAFGISPDKGARMGYVDLAFDVSQYGRLSNFEVLAVQPEEALRADIQVISSLRSTLVRPHIVEGKAVESEMERYRFHFWY